MGRSLLQTNMSENQWKQIHKLNKMLYEDYKIRRELLLKRLDVTIQSFKWADRLKVIISSRNFFFLKYKFRIKMKKLQRHL
jgi:hypothetical protein